MQHLSRLEQSVVGVTQYSFYPHCRKSLWMTAPFRMCDKETIFTTIMYLLIARVVIV